MDKFGGPVQGQVSNLGLVLIFGLQDRFRTVRNPCKIHKYWADVFCLKTEFIFLRETDYEETIGGAEWPSRPFLGSAYKMYMNSSNAMDDLTEEFMEHQVGSNLARVDIFYDTLNVESIEVSATYTVRRTSRQFLNWITK